MSSESDSGNFLVLYGSQTGTAQDFAERIWQDSQRKRLNSRIYSMDSYDIKNLPTETLAVFVCATAGQGEEPDNMKEFWKFLLRKNLPENSLAALRFAVLGLGDSSYQKYNFAAKKLHRRLIQLGATPIIDVGLADDQHDLGADGVAEPWIKSLWETLPRILPELTKLEPIPEDTLLPPKYQVVWEDEKDFELVSSVEAGVEEAESLPFMSSLLENRRVTAQDHFQDTRLLSFDISNSNLKYEPGDVAVVLPQNLQDSMDKFVEIVNLRGKLQRSFSLQPTNECIRKPPVWQLKPISTVQDCIKKYLDLQCIPRRSFFRLLSIFAENELEKERLQEFCAPENQDELFAYCNRPRKTVVEVLEDFKDTAAKVPFEYLFDLLSPIRTRSFSIASCQEIHGSNLQILVAVVEYKTRMSTPRRGLCSTWLSLLEPNDTVPLWIRKGTFKFPSSSSTPKMILIGPGTGIAPFRSYLQSLRVTHVSRDNLLFFGCRNKAKDFYFEEEWLKLESQGVVKLVTAFSRDQEKKVYVQHKIEEMGSKVWEILNSEGAMIFLAGSSNQMPKNVREAISKVAMDFGELSAEEAEELLTEMEKTNRYQLETWS